jgi:dienelactone hydrolase
MYSDAGGSMPAIISKSTIATKSKPKRLVKALLIVIIIIAAFCVAFLVYASDYYHDLDTDKFYQAPTEEMAVTRGSNFLAFGDASAEHALVFYPGAKVEFSAYSPLMRGLAEEGFLCIVVRMPFNFAFFDVDAASNIMEQYPDIAHWWIGGHSLGGAMAAQYAANHSQELEGLLLLGSYSASDLTHTELSVCSIYGSEDLIINMDSLESGRALMPDSYAEYMIAGGNHAGFGNYGKQKGDGQAMISTEEQWRITVQITAEWLLQLLSCSA